MKPAIDLKPFKDLIVLCNGCGEPMRDFGEWPVCFPKPTGDKEGTTMNVQQVIRYGCRTCRTPHEGYAKGIQVMVSILGKAD